jgi:hypothetical protein
LKQPSSANILSVKSTKLRKGTVPRTIASAVVACITPERCGLENLLSALVSKASGGGPSYKIMPRAKKVAPSTKKRIILSMGALVAVSSEGTQESSPHDRAPEILSKAGPRSQSPEPQDRSPMTSGPRSIPKVCLPIAMSVGAAGASTGYLRSLKVVCICVKKRLLILGCCLF